VHLEYVLEPVLVADDAVKGEIVAPGVVARNEQRNILRPFEGVVELFVVGVVDRLHEAAEDAAVFVLLGRHEKYRINRMLGGCRGIFCSDFVLLFLLNFLGKRLSVTTKAQQVHAGRHHLEAFENILWPQELDCTSTH
jgi:hypothetical protein